MNTAFARTIGAVTGLLVAFAAATGWADEEQGRISYATDDALIFGDGEENWSFAGINTVVLEGDRIWADDSGAIEVELPGGNYIRLADGSELEVVDMVPSGVVRGRVGSFYVHRLYDSARGLIFDTGVAQFDFERDTVARFDVLTDGSTTLSVVQGRVGVFTDRGRVMDVGSGYRSYIDPGLLPSSPERYTAGEDTFDVWNRTRVNYFTDYQQPEPFQNEKYVPIGARDLDDYGDWVYVNNAYYWRPIYVTNYVPYRYGHWSYVRNQGHAWVGYYPFDYFTSHYGYWSYDRRYGWLWAYEPVYAPARVVSIYYGDVLFWAPCDRWGYPVYGTHFDLTIGGFRFSLGFSSYAYWNNIYYSGYHCPTYYVQPLHRHVIYNQPSHVQPQVWNHHRRTDLAYWDAARRNSGLREWEGDGASRARGFTQDERRGEARTLAADLESRRGRADFQSASARTTSGTARTSSLDGARTARAREIDSIVDRGIRVSPDQVRGTERTARSTSTDRTPSMGDRDNTNSTVRMETAPTRGTSGTRLDTGRGTTVDSTRTTRVDDLGGGTRTGSDVRGGAEPGRGSTGTDREPDVRSTTRTGTPDARDTRTDRGTTRDDVRTQPPVASEDPEVRTGTIDRGTTSREIMRTPTTRSTAPTPDRSQSEVRSNTTYRNQEPVRAPETSRSATSYPAPEQSRDTIQYRAQEPVRDTSSYRSPEPVRGNPSYRTQEPVRSNTSYRAPEPVRSPAPSTAPSRSIAPQMQSAPAVRPSAPVVRQSAPTGRTGGTAPRI